MKDSFTTPADNFVHDLADFGMKNNTSDSFDSFDDALMDMEDNVKTTETTTCCPAPGGCCGGQCGLEENTSSGLFNKTQSPEELFDSFQDDQCGLFCQASKGINSTLDSLFGNNSTMCDAPKFDNALDVDPVEDDEDSHYDSL
jgi:hypothetical protein